MGFPGSAIIMEAVYDQKFQPGPQELSPKKKKNNFGISLVRKNKIKHKQTKQQTPNRSAFSGKKKN